MRLTSTAWPSCGETAASLPSQRGRSLPGAAVAPSSANRPASIDRRRFLQLAAACATTLWLPRSAWSQPRIRGRSVRAGRRERLADARFGRAVDAAPSGRMLGSSLGLRARHRPLGDRARREVQPDRPEGAVDRRGRARAFGPRRSAGSRARPLVLLSLHGRRRAERGRPHADVSGTRCRRVAPARRVCVVPAVGARLFQRAIGTCARTIRTSCCSSATTSTSIPNAKNAVRVPTGGWVRTLDDFRARYALHKSDADLQAMHAACPWLVTWDDHEVQNDYAGAKEGNSGAPVREFRRAARGGVPGVLRAHAAPGRRAHARARAASRKAPSCASIRPSASARSRRSISSTTGSIARRRPAPATARPGSSTDGSRRSAPIGPIPSARCSDAAQERWLDDAFAHGSDGLEHLGQQTLFGQRDFRSGPGQLVLERRLGRLPRRPRPDDRVDAKEHARQSRRARRRHASELGGPRQSRLRGPGEPLDRRRVLRDEHHLAIRRAPGQRPAREESALHFRRRRAPRLRRRGLHAEAPDDVAARGRATSRCATPRSKRSPNSRSRRDDRL